MMHSTPALFQKIAARIRSLRQERNWSQQDLANHSEVSRRMIALIEQGESNVSIATLDKIGIALGLSFGQLIFSADPEPLRIIKACEMPLLWQQEDSSGRFVFSAPAGDSMELWHWVLTPGEQYQAEPDPQGVEELIYVLSGQLEVHLEGHVYSLVAGDALRFPSQAPYRYFNPGPDTSVFIKNVLKA